MRQKASMKTLNLDVCSTLKRLQYPLAVIQTCVRWYMAYPPRLQPLGEMMGKRGVCVDHFTVHR